MIQIIQNVDDCAPLYAPHSLYLKPLAKMCISVALPGNKMGKSISNLEITDKLSAALKPDKFFAIKVSKHTVDFIRFEAELEQRTRLKAAIARLDGSFIKLNGFVESFRVRASEAKDDFPTRHDWDSFFRDASHMDEMKAGERPDTIYLSHLPIRWFCPRHAENDESVKPSESIFRRIFEKFGCVRCVDIPICDPYRSKMNSDINGMKTFSFDQDVLFEAYVQFDEYVGFTRAMDEFRGMKLVRKYVDKTVAININVSFDKTKHLSDAQMQRRERVRNRLIAKTQAEEEEKERQKHLEEEKLERQRQKEEQEKLVELERQREREEKRKLKHLKKIHERGQVEISQEIRVEERKLMIAQRKLESIRLLEALFDRMRIKHKEKLNSSTRDANEVQREKSRVLLVSKYKAATENLVQDQTKKVKELKSKTPLLGLLSKKSKKQNTTSSEDEDKLSSSKRVRTQTSNVSDLSENPVMASLAPVNPFKAAATMAAAGTYNNEAAEWMKSLSMLPYVQPMFSHPLYRPQTGVYPVSVNYRGFTPRIRGRGRGRGGRGRGNGYPNASYYKGHKSYKYEDEQYEDDAGSDDNYRKYSSTRNYTRSSRSHFRRRLSSRSRSRSRSHSRSRRSHSRYTTSRSRSRTRRSHSRHRRSYTRSRSYSKSRSRSKTEVASKSQTGGTSQRLNKKLVSTRRSRSTDSNSTDSSNSHMRSRSVVIETDNLVRSAEEIKRTIERSMQDRMREEEREIKDSFRVKRKSEKSEQTMRSPPNGEGVNSTMNSVPQSPSSRETTTTTRNDDKLFD